MGEAGRAELVAADCAVPMITHAELLKDVHLVNPHGPREDRVGELRGPRSRVLAKYISRQGISNAVEPEKRVALFLKWYRTKVKELPFDLD